MVVGWLSAERPTDALKLVLVPLVALAVLSPAIPMVLAAGALPYSTSIFGAGGYQVTASDVLLVLGVGGAVLADFAGDRIGINRLKPLIPAFAVYLFAISIAWAHLPSTGGVVAIVQRVELVAAAVVAGAYLAKRGMLQRALLFYVAGASVLAVTAIFVVFVQGDTPENYLGVQKNPAGQAVANALLIVLFHRRLPSRLPFAVLLVAGLVAAQSRGAILATIIAVGIVAALMSNNKRLRGLAIVPVIVAVFYGGFSALPAAQQDRLTNFAPGGDVATETRQNYADDAIAKFRSDPALGTGVGLYQAGSKLDLTYTTDPHNVLLLELAEGGVVLGAGFAVLVLSSGWVLLRRRQRDPIVLCALAVQLSTVIHGVVDVYWVRGTPVMGWLLVGAALWLAADARPDGQEEEAAEPVRASSTLYSSPRAARAL